MSRGSNDAPGTTHGRVRNPHSGSTAVEFIAGHPPVTAHTVPPWSVTPLPCSTTQTTFSITTAPNAPIASTATAIAQPRPSTRARRESTGTHRRGVPRDSASATDPPARSRRARIGAAGLSGGKCSCLLGGRLAVDLAGGTIICCSPQREDAASGKTIVNRRCHCLPCCRPDGRRRGTTTILTGSEPCATAPRPETEPRSATSRLVRAPSDHHPRDERHPIGTRATV